MTPLAAAPDRHLAKGPGLRRSIPRVSPVPAVYKATVTAADGRCYRVWLGKAHSKEHALQTLSLRFPGAAIKVYAA